MYIARSMVLIKTWEANPAIFCLAILAIILHMLNHILAPIIAVRRVSLLLFLIC